jgi:hypothetical protein
MGVTLEPCVTLGRGGGTKSDSKAVGRQLCCRPKAKSTILPSEKNCLEKNYFDLILSNRFFPCSSIFVSEFEKTEEEEEEE